MSTIFDKVNHDNILNLLRTGVISAEDITTVDKVLKLFELYTLIGDFEHENEITYSQTRPYPRKIIFDEIIDKVDKNSNIKAVFDKIIKHLT